MRTRELRCLLAHVASAENRCVLMLTTGRQQNSSIAAKVFASHYFQRYLLRFLATCKTPRFLISGSSGVGKTWLLRELHKHINELMPALNVFRGNGDELLRALYAATGGRERDLTPEQLRLVPILPRAVALGGVVLLVDESGSAPWVESFLGVRIIQVVGPEQKHKSGEAQKDQAYNETVHRKARLRETVHELQGLGEQEQNALATQYGTTKHPIPLWCLLAKGMVDPPSDLMDIVTQTLSNAPRKARLCLSVTRGLTREEAASCGCKSLTPLLSIGKMVRPSPLLRKQLAMSMTKLQRQEAHRVLAALLLTGGPARRAEAVWHLMRVGSTAKVNKSMDGGSTKLSDSDAAKLKTAVCDWDVFPHLKEADLVALTTLIPGGALSIHRDLSGGTAEQQLVLGTFLSAAGEFGQARKELAAARDKLRARARGRACLEMAQNEVRYWDSLRNWQSEKDLTLLIESSQCAVQLLRPANSVASRKVLARALNSWANASFKAACVSKSWEAWLHRSKRATDWVRRLLAGCPPSGVLACAVLVAGVATSVRGHKLQNAQKPYRAVIATALREFQEAERILVLAVGPINEHSMYTHGNMAELYIYSLRDLKNGLIHFYKSYQVGHVFFGPKHPAVQAKLKELLAFIDRLGYPQTTRRDKGLQSIISHAISVAKPVGMTVEEWVEEEPFTSLVV